MQKDLHRTNCLVGTPYAVSQVGSKWERSGSAERASSCRSMIVSNPRKLVFYPEGSIRSRAFAIAVRSGQPQGEPPFQWKTVPQGAATSVCAAVVAPAEEIGAKCCVNCHVSSFVPDNQTIGLMTDGVRGYAPELDNAKALWKQSGQMVGKAFA